MRISDNEVKKILSQADSSVVQEIDAIEEARIRQQDQSLVSDLAVTVASMPDREELVSDLKARIEQGIYRPTADAIVDGMVRRAIADRIR